MQVIGGIMGTIDIWELAIIPMLLNNSDTWISIPDETIEVLENLQNLFLRTMLQVPISCPKAALLWETATIKMKLRIWKKKLNLYKYLQAKYSGQIFNEQRDMQFPGFINECKAIARELNIVERHLLERSPKEIKVFCSTVSFLFVDFLSEGLHI